MQQSKIKAKGITFAFSATLLWSVNFVISRGLSETIPPITIAFFRWFTALIIITPITLKAFKKQWHVIKQHKAFFIVAAILGVTIFNTLIYAAGHTTTATNMSLIAITAPVFIILLARIFYKEKFPGLSILGVCIVIFGVLNLITKGNLLSLLDIRFVKGDILMLIAASCFASYSVLMRKKPKEVTMPVLLFVTIFIGTIFLLLAFIFEQAQSKPISFNLNLLLILLYLGVVASIIGFYLWNSAVLLIGSQITGIIYYALPLFSATFAILILGEKIALFHIISLISIISGILIASYFKLKKK